jgi:hypothetical protein
MQPRPERPVVDPRPGARNRGTGRKVPMPVVDPRPGKKKIMLPSPNPKATKAAPIKVNPPSVDDKIYRTMPITEKQLKGIKKMYGIK